MFKHANTLETNDRVRRTHKGIKLAGEGATGTVTGVSPEGDKFRIRFDDESYDYVSPEDLAKL